MQRNAHAFYISAISSSVRNAKHFVCNDIWQGMRQGYRVQVPVHVETQAEDEVGQIMVSINSGNLRIISRILRYLSKGVQLVKGGEGS